MSHPSPSTTAVGTVDHAEYLRILAELEAERAARVALETHYHTIMEQHTANTAALAETRQQVRALRTKVVAATTQGQQLFRAQGDKIVSLRRYIRSLTADHQREIDDLLKRLRGHRGLGSA
ncbi:hypothetical protein HMN09_00549900 [Mycena chlorophos]|uniref:Uncharacterized protein n=1 Tax=Mycena chlorophos TaxID=658473 RepID=A0A8H6TC66_MYCCL|nr:hypothetical protein HMN09_00549900 [Mycena chlorophos]